MDIHLSTGAGRSGAYWDRKISRNIERDKVVTEQLVESGWSVLRFWDFEIENDPPKVANQVKAALERAGRGERVVEVHEMLLADGPLRA